eukprot:XP_028336440.1 LIM domain kinase 2 [Physeter catodon]
MAEQAGEDAWRCRGCGDHVALNQRLYRTVSEAWHSSCFRLCAKGLCAVPCRIQTQTVWLWAQAGLQHSNGRAQVQQPGFKSWLHLSRVQLGDLRQGI